MPVGFVFVFAWRQAWIKRKKQNACWICICVCLKAGLDKKEETNCLLDLYLFCARWLKSEKGRTKCLLDFTWNWFVHGDWHWWNRSKLLNCFGLGKGSDTIWTLSSLKIVEIIVGWLELYLDHSGSPGWPWYDCIGGGIRLTRCQSFAGKTDSTFYNIWDLIIIK